jgi:branched-chain amino acid transport system substrate-binding protein
MNMLNQPRQPRPGRPLRRMLSGIVAVGTAAITLAACGSPSSSDGTASKAPITLNAVLPLTGSVAFVGVGEKEALDLVAQQANAAGGINGSPVQVSIVDDQSVTSTAVSQASQLIQQNVSVLFIGGTVAQIAPVQKLARPSGPLILALTPGTSVTADSTQFVPGDVPTSIAPDDILNYILSKHWTRVALMHSNDPSGQGGYAEVKQALSNSKYRSLQVVADETFNSTDVTATNQLLKIKNANPQVMVEWSSGPPTGIVFESMQQVGLLSLPVIESNGNADVPTMKAFTTVPDTVLAPAPAWICGTQGLTSAQATPVNQMEAAYHAAKATPGIGTTEMWDLAEAVVAALKEKGTSATSSQLTAAMEAMHDFNGIDTVYNFGASNHLGTGVSSYRLCKWVPSTDEFQPASVFGGDANT